ncbi:MAG: hypothetical protein WBB01_01125 [Phormidesmis sp.]
MAHLLCPAIGPAINSLTSIQIIAIFLADHTLTIEWLIEAFGHAAMTPREELIQSIQTAPDDIIFSLLDVLKGLQQRSDNGVQADVLDVEVAQPEQISDRLHEKNGFLVIETGEVSDLDINAFIKEMREERIQNQIDRLGL